MTLLNFSAARQLRANNPKRRLMYYTLLLLVDTPLVTEQAIQTILTNTNIPEWQIMNMYWNNLNREAHKALVLAIYAENLELSKKPKNEKLIYIDKKFGV